MAKTPMMQQYDEAKAIAGDALLLFRMGDFYELFHEDARIASRELGLSLTSRDKGENPVPMAGFPHHQLEPYLSRLINAGFRAAVCEQVQDPKEAKGLVKREIARIVSPGTLTDDAMLDPRESNYLLALVPDVSQGGARDKLIEEPGDQQVGFAWADLSTGRFQASVFRMSELADQLVRIGPAEVLVDEEADCVPEYLTDQFMLTRRPVWAFGLDSAKTLLSKQFGTKHLDGFGFTNDDNPAIRAAGALLDYLVETQKSSLDHFESLLPYRTGSTLEIDEATRRSLEITKTLRDGSRDGSLLSVIDRTVTARGSRLLADWISNPLTNQHDIECRHDSVEELTKENRLRDTLREKLREVYDIERLLARVSTGRASPRDLAHIGRTLRQLPPLKEVVNHRQSALLKRAYDSIDLCPELCESLESALVDDCPVLDRDGGLIRDGYSEELDELRKLAAGGKQWIAEYQSREAERIGVTNLKVGFNKVFGYYLELSNANKDKAPEEYIRKQTLKNAERYITPELKEYEEAVLSSDDKAKVLEYELFLAIRDQVHEAQGQLKRTADQLASLAVLQALAELAVLRGYCRPVMQKDPVLEIRGGRHPVLDITEPDGTFVPNDTVADHDDKNLLLITGPNMAGKSTYIRQVALITLMAQGGSFVPATSAVIGIADRIFARVGASDELSRGQSTFMVEMTETARILNTATKRSLIILDEIGRGTSTYDGVSLAWAIVEFIHEKLQARTLFATHYHELTDLSLTLERLTNLNVSVKEWEDNVVFLHKIVEGSADKSYGIHVAKLAGVPRSVNDRATEILGQLEASHGGGEIAISSASRSSDSQMSLFGGQEHPLLDHIREIDLNHLTPMQAIVLIQKWQTSLQDD
ncbi:MAG: DNA mismatch repair protein MutS [Pirellulales bacterium]|nr:DNA mismatch repair protein MutS [Pirellulales bacterium]